MPAGLGLGNIIRKYKSITDHCRSLMPIAKRGRDIDVPAYHRFCPRPDLESERTDEFSCVYDDDEDTYPYTQTIQDYSCMINEENTIYDAVFGEVKLESDESMREDNSPKGDE